MKPRDERGPTIAKRVNWDLYDVPNIWLIVRDEDSQAAADLVMTFNKMSQYVDDTHLRLTEAAKRLALGWSGSAAADSAQAQLTEIATALQRDSAAYATATRELSNIIDRLGEAKVNVEYIYQLWKQLKEVPKAMGQLAGTVVESEVYQDEVSQTQTAARDEMRSLDRDLSGARITMTEEFQPSTGKPSTTDMQLAGLGPRAIEASRGWGGGGGHQLVASEQIPVVPTGVSTGAATPISSGRAPVRQGVPGVIGATGSERPMTTGMMGAGMAGMGAGAKGGATGGKADELWSARRGVDGVIDSVPPPDPSRMGVDDSFDRDQN